MANWSKEEHLGNKTSQEASCVSGFRMGAIGKTSCEKSLEELEGESLLELYWRNLHKHIQQNVCSVCV